MSLRWPDDQLVTKHAYNTDGATSAPSRCVSSPTTFILTPPPLAIMTHDHASRGQIRSCVAARPRPPRPDPQSLRLRDLRAGGQRLRAARPRGAPDGPAARPPRPRAGHARSRQLARICAAHDIAHVRRDPGLARLHL